MIMPLHTYIHYMICIAASLDIMQFDSGQLYYTCKQALPLTQAMSLDATVQALPLTLTVVCNPPCANGTGVCVANNTCSCAPGYFGDTCSEQGKLHCTQLILQLYQLGFMPCIRICTSIGGYVQYMHCSLTHKLN